MTWLMGGIAPAQPPHISSMLQVLTVVNSLKQAMRGAVAGLESQSKQG